MARYSDGDEDERIDYLEQYFSNHIEDYLIEELETEHDSSEDIFNHTNDFSNKEKELENFIDDFENID